MISRSTTSGAFIASCQATIAAPVVADDDRLLLAEVLDDRDHVADEQAHVVVLDAGRLVAEVVAALIDRHHLETIRQPFHLAAPRVPVVGEAVDHDHERPGAQAGVVDLHAVRVGVAVL